jgi:hypothetical protein
MNHQNHSHSPLSRSLCLLSFLIAPIASSAIIVSDQFNSGYPTNAQLLQNVTSPGGTGWDGNWIIQQTGNSYATYQDTSHFSSNPPTNGTPALAGGSVNKAGTRDGSNARETTDLTSYVDTPGDSVWFSYMVALRGEFTAGQFDLGFASGTSTNTGIGISITGANVHARINNNLSTDTYSYPHTTGTTFGESLYIVGQFTEGGGSDTLNVWVNEGTTIDLNAPTLSVSDDLTGTPDRFSFNSVPVSTVHIALNENVAMWVDEIFLAEDAIDLGVTAIPEPSSILLLLTGLIGVGLLKRRRR